MKQKFVFILMIVLTIVITACTSPKPIGGERDLNGCLTPAGYSWDEEVGACTRTWELEGLEKQAARMAVVVQSFYPVTVVDVKEGGCEYCFVVTLQGESEPWDMDIDLTNIIENIESFDDCVEAGFPVMESYPRQCNANGKTFTEEIKNQEVQFTECVERTDRCTKELHKVCAVADNGIRCITEPCQSTDVVDKSNPCMACSDEEVFGYYEGSCESNRFAICENSNGFDIEKIAEENGWICVDICPGNYDAYGTQIGSQMCILHYGEEEILAWETCEKSTGSCDCVKAYETTDNIPIKDPEYRCVPDQYAERLLFRGGTDRLDENGEQSVMIA